MIYLDTSVLLAHLLAEDRAPPRDLWSEPLVSSRLLEYETWVRIHARGLADSHGDHVRSILARIGLVEMVGPVLERVTDSFPSSIRTLDGLHLASADFLRAQGVSVRLASYDERMVEAARDLDIRIYPLS